MKTGILWGMAVLIPAMAGGTGFRLGGRSCAPLILAKRRRMPLIALNGLLVLIPCAAVLQAQAAAGRFDLAFGIAQAIEFAAGALNVTLLGLNMRDGLRLAYARRRARQPLCG